MIDHANELARDRCFIPSDASHILWSEPAKQRTDLMTKITCLIAPFLMMLGSATSAQEWIVGAGFADFSFDLSNDSALVAVEYHHPPFNEGTRLNVGWGAVGAVHTSGDLFLGLGLVGTYDLGSRWFLEGSVMPGAFLENASFNDLGSTFEIRSLIGVGYELKSGNALSLALAHKSNASTAEFNPGVNSLLLRWHVRY
jgi:lipid A 3-O-deacylase